MSDPGPHHTPRGFRNNDPAGRSRRSVLQRYLERRRKGLPYIPPGGWRFETSTPDVAWIRANRDVSALTWIRHATFLAQWDGVNLLTDPHLTARASPLRFAGPLRLHPPALDFHDLPHVHAVVISHNHYDHLDETTVRRLAAQASGSPRFFVPLGLKAWFAGRGIHDVVELGWWQAAEHAGLRFTFLPVQHWSARGLGDQNRTLWGGWRIDGGRSLFFAGDTGYSRDFLEIARRLGPVDTALLPIGAYEPRWFMKVMHVNPEEAVRIHQDLQARQSLAMHWGTFVLTDEPMDEPPRRLAAALRAAGIPADRFLVLRHGETIRPHA
jgi:L-ascorbate metabolism protein UlaG (beta-lactamase superfamily)